MSKRLKYTKDILTHLLHANAQASGGGAQGQAAASGGGVGVNAGVKKVGAGGELPSVGGGTISGGTGLSSTKNQSDKAGKTGTAPSQPFTTDIK